MDVLHIAVNIIVVQLRKHKGQDYSAKNRKQVTITPVAEKETQLITYQ